MPFSITVPTPVGVNTPPSPAPFALILSISVPIGVSSTSISPAVICFPVSGFVPTWLVISFFICLLTINLPLSHPGVDVSFEIIVKFLALFSIRPSISLSGAPQLKKPPIIIVVPSFIKLIASLTDTIFAKTLIPHQICFDFSINIVLLVFVNTIFTTIRGNNKW